MAIYHFSAKVIGRSAGRSAVAAAAYRAAERLQDQRQGVAHDYRAKAGVVHSEIVLPEGAPERWRDRETLWNEVEAAERRKDATLAREVEIALPRELDRDEAIRLVREFVQEQFVSRGMVADLAVHWGRTRDGEDQPHAHVMLTMRGVEGDGFGPKRREWNDKALLRGWRERWAEAANARLAELDLDARIDHRTLRDQGIEGLEPQGKIGAAAQRMEARGEGAERAAEHAEAARRNGERIAADPALALDALTRQQSTFTRRDLARFVSRHTDGAKQFQDVMAKVEASPELVRVGRDGRGQERFTSREMLAVERRLAEAAAALAGRRAHRAAAADAAGLGAEQAAALAHVTGTEGLAAVVGYAGTGKSTMLGRARAAWEAAGCRVRGAALSGIAAEGLEGGAGIESRTLASLEHAWSQGRDGLTARDVLVVDEAGMIGSRQMERVLSAAAAAGAKVVLVGDAEQLQAIEAGAAFRAVVERAGAAEITEIRRQRAGWQQEATREFATGRTEAALGRYEAEGYVVRSDTLDAAKARVVATWDAWRAQRPGASQIVLAHRRADVRDLNELARGVRRAKGELGPDQEVETARGRRAFAARDRVYFLKNERSLGVKNGTLGTVAGVRDGVMVVDLDGKDGGPGRRVSVKLSDYNHVDHGYAATVHKSQGVTVDYAHVLATGGMDRHAAYVGMTRHRVGAVLHWSLDEFGGRERMGRVLGRERAKDTSLDYAERRGLEPERAEGVARGLARALGAAIGAGREAERQRQAQELARRQEQERQEAERRAERERQREAAELQRQAEQARQTTQAQRDAARQRPRPALTPEQEAARRRAEAEQAQRRQAQEREAVRYRGPSLGM